MIDSQERTRYVRIVLARQRHTLILNALAKSGFVALHDAVSITGASEATLRRDFAELEAQGSLRRHRGGVERGAHSDSGPVEGPFATLSLESRVALRDEAKRLIAERAAMLCEPGQTIFLDAGSTTLRLAPLLASMPVRVITNSFAAARALLTGERAQVLLTGGEIDRTSEVLFGYLDDPIVGSYPPDVAFLSAQGIDGAGVWNSDERLIRLEQRVAASAKRCVLLADSSKFGVRGRIRFCGLEEIHTVVTDAGIESTHQTLVEAAGNELIVVR